MEDLANVDLYQPSPYVYMQKVQNAASIAVASTDFKEGDTLPKPQLSAAFGVPGGEDLSPQLSWEAGPAGTKSYVVTCYDPDAPTVSGFWHWVMYDIPANVTSLEAGAGNKDASVVPYPMLKNDAGFTGFLGAAPPPGHKQHRYLFAVTALSVDKLPITEDVTPAVAMFNMFGSTLARGVLTALFGQ
eukprot:gene8840-904_t